MKKAIVIPALISLIFSNYLCAQVPGFEGNKFTVYYYGTLGPRTSNPAYYTDLKDDQSTIGINYRHNIDADYVVSKSVSIGVGFKALRTSADGFEISQTGYYDANNSYYTTNISTGPINMETKFFSVFVKQFLFKKSGYIAPVGSYQKFELAFGVTNTTGGAFYETLNIPTIKTLAIFYTIGQQQLIARRIFIDYGFEIGFTPTLIGKALASASTNDGDASYDTDATTATKVELRLFEHILFNAHLGTGILLF